MVVMVCQVGMVKMERRVTRETLAHLDLSAPAVEGWCTLAGDEQPALTHQEQSWCMQEELGGHGTALRGDGTNYLCLPESPDYLNYTAGVQGASPVHGVEYETGYSAYIVGPLASVHDHNAPCSVCSTTARVMVLMLPAKTQCPPSWTLEYNGYLMTEGHINGYSHHRTTFECVDKDPECIPDSAGNVNGALFYHTEASCTGLPCPPYDPQKELTCAVCTK